MRFRTALLAGLISVLTTILVVQAQVPGVNSTLNSVFTLAYDNSTMKQTFSSMAQVVANVAGGATDVCTLTGSATKTIRVRRIYYNMIATTAVTDPVAILKRSTANSAGTSFSMIPVPYDSRNSAATATVLMYTANPTTGTLVGVLADPMFSVGNLTTGGAQGFPSEFQFGRLGQPILLRGIAEVLAINLNSQGYSGNLTTCGFEWTEDNDT